MSIESFKNEEIITVCFLKYLKALANDKVTSVRITLAQVISRQILKKSKYSIDVWRNLFNHF